MRTVRPSWRVSAKGTGTILSAVGQSKAGLKSLMSPSVLTFALSSEFVYGCPVETRRGFKVRRDGSGTLAFFAGHNAALSRSGHDPETAVFSTKGEHCNSLFILLPLMPHPVMPTILRKHWLRHLTKANALYLVSVFFLTSLPRTTGFKKCPAPRCRSARCEWNIKIIVQSFCSYSAFESSFRRSSPINGFHPSGKAAAAARSGSMTTIARIFRRHSGVMILHDSSSMCIDKTLFGRPS